MKKFELRTSSGDIFAFVSKEKHTPWIYVQLVGSVDLTSLKRTMLKYTNVITKQGCHYVLSDRRISEGNWFEINHWIEHKWAPMAIRVGLQYIAHVTAPTATSQLAAQDLASRIIGFEFKSFESMEDAESWLREQVA
jgi:hypothetical protein